MSYSEFEDKRAKSVDLDEVVHDEPPHQDLRCLHIQLFSSLVFNELNIRTNRWTYQVEWMNGGWIVSCHVFLLTLQYLF